MAEPYSQSKARPVEKEPLVSVIMNCFNGEKYLREAIDSVLEQTYQNWEIIFWDNQSTDQSAATAQSYDNPRINYIYADTFTSLGEARNLAIKEAKGELIAFLDADDKWLPEKLTKQVPLFGNSQVGIVISDTYFFGESGIKKQLYLNKKPPRGEVFRELLGSYFVSLETAVIRRSALDSQDHWFDTRFDVIEEYDLFVRLAYHWQLDYVDDVLAMWRVHADSWTWACHDLFPVEKRLMLDELSKLIPDFDSEYEQEIQVVRRICDFGEAEAKWAQGENREARKIMRKYRSTGAKWTLVYLLMWGPFSIYQALRKIGGAVRP